MVGSQPEISTGWLRQSLSVAAAEASYKSRTKRVVATVGVSSGRGFNSPRLHHLYFNGGSKIGSGVCDAGQGLLCFAAISPVTRSQRSLPKLL
jgi:hypothetical protein